jgi:hypothetical protein
MANNSRSLTVQFVLEVASSLERAQPPSEIAVRPTRTNVSVRTGLFVSDPGLSNTG